MTAKTLIIDDDPSFNAILVRIMMRRGFPTQGATDVEAALSMAREQLPQQIVLDLNLNGSSGLALIPQLLAINPDCRIVVLTGYASIATAVDAVKLGAVLAAFEDDDGPDFGLPVSEEPLSVDRMEWEHIQRILNENEGNISATARALKMHRRTLQRKLSKRPVKT
jgi:two-component system response regulator RegA